MPRPLSLASGPGGKLRLKVALRHGVRAADDRIKKLEHRLSAQFSDASEEPLDESCVDDDTSGQDPAMGNARYTADPDVDDVEPAEPAACLTAPVDEPDISLAAVFTFDEANHISLRQKSASFTFDEANHIPLRQKKAASFTVDGANRIPLRRKKSADFTLNANHKMRTECELQYVGAVPQHAVIGMAGNADISERPFSVYDEVIFADRRDSCFLDSDDDATPPITPPSRSPASKLSLVQSSVMSDASSETPL